MSRLAKSYGPAQKDEEVSRLVAWLDLLLHLDESVSDYRIDWQRKLLSLPPWRPAYDMTIFYIQKDPSMEGAVHWNEADLTVDPHEFRSQSAGERVEDVASTLYVQLVHGVAPDERPT